MPKHYKADSHKPGRCGHTWCTDCAKRRGSNRGNRRLRQAAKRALRAPVRDAS